MWLHRITAHRTQRTSLEGPGSIDLVLHSPEKILVLVVSVAAAVTVALSLHHFSTTSPAVLQTDSHLSEEPHEDRDLLVPFCS